MLLGGAEDAIRDTGCVHAPGFFPTKLRPGVRCGNANTRCILLIRGHLTCVYCCCLNREKFDMQWTDILVAKLQFTKPLAKLFDLEEDIDVRYSSKLFLAHKLCFIL